MIFLGVLQDLGTKGTRQRTIDLEFRISDGKMEIEDVLIRRANVLLWVLGGLSNWTY